MYRSSCPASMSALTSVRSVRAPWCRAPPGAAPTGHLHGPATLDSSLVQYSSHCSGVPLLRSRCGSTPNTLLNSKRTALSLRGAFAWRYPWRCLLPVPGHFSSCQTTYFSLSLFSSKRAIAVSATESESESSGKPNWVHIQLRYWFICRQGSSLPGRKLEL